MNCEVLPENYRFVARRDRLKSAHRGVAVIAKSDLEGVEVDTPSDTEFVAASFTCKYLKKPLIYHDRLILEVVSICLPVMGG
jgi:hypothetical protein